MAYQAIGLGSSENDGSGDTLRVGGDKVNDNFVEIYTALGTGTALTSGITADADDVTLVGASANAVWDKSDNALEFADNAIAKFGTAGDLQIYHNGSHSYIAETGDGTGNLFILATDITIGDQGNAHTYLSGTSGGAVAIYHDNAMKFTTASDGIAVTGVVAATTLEGTLTTAAQTNITSVGTLSALQVDNININGGDITSTTGPLNITPVSGSAIVLDGTISVDAGVVTGATSITSTAFVGALTGNADTATSATSASSATTAGTVTTAAQTNITSVGTLTALTVDNVSIDGTNIGHTSDTDLISLASGAVTVNGDITATGEIYYQGVPLSYFITQRVLMLERQTGQ